MKTDAGIGALTFSEISTIVVVISIEPPEGLDPLAPPDGQPGMPDMLMVRFIWRSRPVC